jgi:tellurite resistance protein TerC
MHRFIYLKQGLAVVLVVVGIKMLTEDVYHISIWISLGFIALVLVSCIALSLIVTGKRGDTGHAEHGHSSRPEEQEA